ncbi:MAG: ATP-binding cassette domain-containing protein [Acidimicrobiales bacterium]
MALAIEAHGLTKTYRTDRGEVAALRGVDLEVAEGRIFGYLGRNGQGKSTTVRILTGLTLPTDGRAEVLGSDVVARRDHVQRQIGVTLQDVALDDLQTGREHLVLVASLWGLDRRAARRRADELLEEFGLTGAATRVIRGYSGGMRRRLDLATSLLGDPRVLFLDEPTTGLDPQSRRALWSRIEQLRSGGVSVFLTTQYLEEADALADELAIIDAGRVVACGTPQQLRTDLGSTRIEVRILDDADREAARGLLGVERTVHALGDRLRFEVAESAEAARLIARLAADGIEPDELDVRTSSLEDVFLGLTGAGIDAGSGRDGDSTALEPVAA